MKQVTTRVDKNLYVRNGHYLTIRQINGKQVWESLGTTDLDEARRKMRGETAPTPSAAIVAELQELRALVKVLVSAHGHGPAAPQAENPANPPRPPLPESVQAFLASREFASHWTRFMYRRCGDLILEATTDWEDLEKKGPYEVWRHATQSQARRNTCETCYAPSAGGRRSISTLRIPPAGMSTGKRPRN
jgi:hypothetical protein